MIGYGSFGEKCELWNGYYLIMFLFIIGMYVLKKIDFILCFI